MNTASKKGIWIAIALIALCVATALGALFFGRKVFPENLSPAMKSFRSYTETKGLEIDGALVRRDGSNARYRAILHIGEQEDNRFFFIDEFARESDARLRKEQLRANDMVTPARVVQNSTFVLYISNDWDPNDPLAEKLKETFQSWRAVPSPATQL